VPAVRDAGGSAGVHEVLEVRERLRHGEAPQRRRECVGEERQRDGVAGPWLALERVQRPRQPVVVVLGDLACASGRIENPLAVAG
jgi:hypothetical protein